ncbi:MULTISPECIES: hypothetical protein [Nostocales]|uniref:Uncharacterized protein n=3 Tax=Nostocales TaxID=1161 RepID=A0A8S9T080_9CYAN|nr:hypothetical protein [Tolypothrix bouteillei]KAF3886031.1 hypothetical protein DA73_0400011525 [Tolypothrix bouteillei VB521301]
MYNCSFDVGEPSNLERQALPLRRQLTPYLPTVNILEIMETEAGNRTQSVVKQAGNNTGVNGKVALGKQVLEKCLRK